MIPVLIALAFGDIPPQSTRPWLPPHVEECTVDRFATAEIECTTCQVYRFADDPLAACAALEQQGYQCQCRTHGAPSAHDQVMCRPLPASDGAASTAALMSAGTCDTLGPSPQDAAARGGCRWGTGATLCGLSTVSLLLVTSLVVRRRRQR